MIQPATHLQISPTLVGEPFELSQGRATVRLLTTDLMAADERGLVHGGFTFGLADYAAMLAVNDPHVILGSAETRFLAPVRVGEELVARAEVIEEKGKKRIVVCTICTVESDREVMAATFTCFVLGRHVFDAAQE